MKKLLCVICILVLFSFSCLDLFSAADTTISVREEISADADGYSVINARISHSSQIGNTSGTPVYLEVNTDSDQMNEYLQHRFEYGIILDARINEIMVLVSAEHPDFYVDPSDYFPERTQYSFLSQLWQEKVVIHSRKDEENAQVSWNITKPLGWSLSKYDETPLEVSLHIDYYGDNQTVVTHQMESMVVFRLSVIVLNGWKIKFEEVEMKCSMATEIDVFPLN